MSDKQLKSVPVFEIRKKYAWKDNVLRYVQILIVLLILVGTVIWVLISVDIPYQKTWQNLLDRLKPKATETKENTSLSAEEKIKKFGQENKLFEVTTISRTQQGDLEVSTKEGIVIFIDDKKELTQQLNTLQTLLTKAKIDNKNLKKVDFRFSKIIEEF